MAILLETVIAELEAHLVVVGPILEGFQDYERLNLNPQTLAVAQAGTVTYTALRAAIIAAISALQGVATQGYPALPTFAATATAVDDLTINSATIRAALGQITAAPVAVKINFAVSEEEPV